MKNYFAAAILLLLGGLGASAQKESATPPKFTPVEVVSAVEAPYPVNSVAQGTVILEVTVSKEGEIGTIHVLKDIPSLTEPAKRAVKDWKFKAATWNGKPVAGSIALSFSFRTVARY